MTEKPVYEPGTILVITTWDGKHTDPHFFKIVKRRPNGNYTASQFEVQRLHLPEFDTCEGSRHRCVLPDLFVDSPHTVNLRWYESKKVFSFQPMLPGFGITSNEIYNPEKAYYFES
jgi:hypothetical protein